MGVFMLSDSLFLRGVWNLEILLSPTKPANPSETLEFITEDVFIYLTADFLKFYSFDFFIPEFIFATYYLP